MDSLHSAGAEKRGTEVTIKRGKRGKRPLAGCRFRHPGRVLEDVAQRGDERRLGSAVKRFQGDLLHHVTANAVSASAASE